MNEITTIQTNFDFNFEDSVVRIREINGEIWFVAADVASALDISRTDDAVSGLPEDEKGADTIRTLGGDQIMTVVSEAGLFRLIFKSRKESAKRFQRWVLHEVLPSIRKTGSYSVGAQKQIEMSKELKLAYDKGVEAAKATTTYKVGELVKEVINPNAVSRLDLAVPWQDEPPKKPKMTKELQKFLQTPCRQLTEMEFATVVNLLSRS